MHFTKKNYWFDEFIKYQKSQKKIHSIFVCFVTFYESKVNMEVKSTLK